MLKKNEPNGKKFKNRKIVFPVFHFIKYYKKEPV